jgi:poly(A) polymerase
MTERLTDNSAGPESYLLEARPESGPSPTSPTPVGAQAASGLYALSRDRVDPDALKVIERLTDYGYHAYVCGGGVRDLLLGLRPKDFDVATDAHPGEIRKIFRNCRIIGKRFRLAHVYFSGGKIIETSTFRASAADEAEAAEGEAERDLLITDDNVFGTVETDARRRDFTINGLFYDVNANRVIDHVGGVADLEARVVRTIGEPEVRFREDPVRMLRAVKFAGRLGLTIEARAWQEILNHSEELRKAAPARVFLEVGRMLGGGGATRTYRLLQQTGMLRVILPAVGDYLERHRGTDTETEFWAALDVLDEFRHDGVELTEPLLLTVLFAPVLSEMAGREGVDANHPHFQDMLDHLLIRLSGPNGITKRQRFRMVEILVAQKRLNNHQPGNSNLSRIIHRDYFGEAMLFFELFCRAGGHLSPYDVDILALQPGPLPAIERGRDARPGMSGGMHTHVPGAEGHAKRRRRRSPRPDSSAGSSGEGGNESPAPTLD